MTDMKRYYIEVDVAIDREEEPWPTGNAVTEGVARGLPKEYFDEGDEWHIAGMRTASHFADENALSRTRDELHSAATQLSISEEELERVNTLVDSRGAVISDLNTKLSTALDKIEDAHTQISEGEALLTKMKGDLAASEAQCDMLSANQAPVRTEHISVGILDDEAETLIDTLEGEVGNLLYSAIEDVVRDIERFQGGISDLVRDNLPIMDERDLGWGDDDQLQVLEAYAETMQSAADGLAHKLDNIRTGR